MGPGSRGIWELRARQWSGSGQLRRVYCSEVGAGELGLELGHCDQGAGQGSLGREELTSEEATVFEVLLDDDIGDSIEYKLDVLRVGSARHVGIDLLHVASHVELEELHLDVVARVLVRVGPWRGKGLSLSVPNPGGREERRPRSWAWGAPWRRVREPHRRSRGSRC